MEMCDVISRSFATSSNSIDHRSCLYGTHVTRYRVVTFYRLSSLMFIFQASGILNLIFGGFVVLVITGITVILNFVTAILITCRILYFNKYIGKAGLQYNSPYTTIIIICVESSALIVVFGLIYFILYFQQANASYIPMQLLVHVYVSLYSLLRLCNEAIKKLIYNSYTLGLISTSHHLSGRPREGCNHQTETFQACCIGIELRVRVANTIVDQ